MIEKLTGLERGPSVPAELQRVVSLANSGELERAAEVAKSILDEAMARESWRVLAAANANLQRFDAALDSIDRALRLDPISRALQIERALLLSRAGQDERACAVLESLAREPLDSPELAGHLGRALRATGRLDEAEAVANAALDRWPADVPLHRLLAELRWNRGAGADCVARLEQAIAAQPQELQLRLVAADVLRSAGAPERALPLLEEGLRRAPGAAAFETSVGVLLGDLGRLHEALPLLRAAAARLPDSAQMRRNLVPVLLRAGEYAEAGRICESLLAATPDDQLLIAYLAAALRMAADARYSRLQDYDRLVRHYVLAPPKGYSDLGTFNAALARELDRLHFAAQRPLSQSIRGGTQTDRNLPLDNPVIRALFTQLDAPIRDYIGRLGAAPAHPTDRRRTSNYRIAGSWSVRLQSGGYHTNHVHPQGWISSAYYVELPPDMESDTRAGWLQFGELSPAIPGCDAQRFVKPQAGMLVLFPSFLWHGTVPFEKGTRRLTVAFDVLPA